MPHGMEVILTDGSVYVMEEYSLKEIMAERLVSHDKLYAYLSTLFKSYYANTVQSSLNRQVTRINFETS